MNNQDTQKKKSRLPILFLCVLALAAITAGALLYMANNDTRSPKLDGAQGGGPNVPQQTGTGLLESLGEGGAATRAPESESWRELLSADAEPVPTATPAPTPRPTPVPTPTPMPEPVTILLSAAGDCTLGGDANTSGAIRRFEDYAKKNGYDYYFKNVADIFLNDDISIVNLEGALTTSKAKRSGRKFNFRGDPANAQILTGIEVATCANNHSYDFKEQGFKDTQAAVEAQGIGFAGFSVVYYGEYKGVKVGVLGVTPWEYKTEEITKMVSEAKAQCQLLIVAVHWGEERQEKPTEAQYKLGCAIIDAGGDAVLGNHSHVVGGIHRYKDRYIVYSMGNFCYGGHKNPADKDCYIFQQKFVVNGDGTVEDGGINVIPCSVSSVSNKNDFRPTPLTGAKAKTVLQKLKKRSINIDLSGLNWDDSFIGYELGVVKKIAPTAQPTQNAQ